MTDTEYIRNLRTPGKEDPLRILMSACLTGVQCAYDGSDYGTYPGALKLLEYDNVVVIRFCPEVFSFGTPREMCDIYGGNGDDVLDGKAKVLAEDGSDWTAGMIKASEAMLALAQTHQIELAVMMDISAACGSQVIYEGSRFAENKVYQMGAGVCTAQLRRHGFKVISQRDFESLELLYAKIDKHHIIDPAKTDHHQTDWYQAYFKIEK